VAGNGGARRLSELVLCALHARMMMKWYRKVRDTSARCFHRGQSGGRVRKVVETGRRRREAVQTSNLARMPRVACCGHMGFRSALSNFVVASDIVPRV